MVSANALAGNQERRVCDSLPTDRVVSMYRFGEVK